MPAEQVASGSVTSEPGRAAVRTLAVHCAQWPAVCVGRAPQVPVAVLRANRCISVSPGAAELGVLPGLRRREAQARCPSIELHDQDEQREGRLFEVVLSELEQIAPRLEVRDPGDCAMATLGPARYHGGDRSLAELVRTRVHEALAEQLAPVARSDEQAGWCWLPDGEELYLATIEQHTTLRSSPQELHDLGRRLCEEDLPQEFRSLGPAALDTDELTEIFARLRSDPALRHRDADEVVAIARDAVATATDAMPSWFGRLPSSACQVEPIPDFLAADAPYAYYFPPAADGSRPGTYFINTADPAGSSRTEAQSIAFHEAIPGHHLQIAISQELDGLPEFQRHDGATSYIEGWGLYAERLADEMGLYSGPLDRIGMLTADAWRSARLVVDTGLHALGWSRQRAVDYFVEHTPVPIDQVGPEVDRYMAMPGQALSYKVGQLEIDRLRAVAVQRLGDDFQIAAFHDVVLGQGAVTLPVLAGMVEDWLSSAA